LADLYYAEDPSIGKIVIACTLGPVLFNVKKVVIGIAVGQDANVIFIDSSVEFMG
jgi:hypothetical protein